MRSSMRRPALSPGERKRSEVMRSPDLAVVPSIEGMFFSALISTPIQTCGGCCPAIAPESRVSSNASTRQVAVRYLAAVALALRGPPLQFGRGSTWLLIVKFRRLLQLCVGGEI